MTRILEEALQKVHELPAEEQDSIGAIILQELESEEKWSRLFKEHPGVLRKLAEEALDDHNAGRTTPLDPDKL